MGCQTKWYVLLTACFKSLDAFSKVIGSEEHINIETFPQFPRICLRCFSLIEFENITLQLFFYLQLYSLWLFLNVTIYQKTKKKNQVRFSLSFFRKFQNPKVTRSFLGSIGCLVAMARHTAFQLPMCAVKKQYSLTQAWGRNFPIRILDL